MDDETEMEPRTPAENPRAALHAALVWFGVFIVTIPLCVLLCNEFIDEPYSALYPILFSGGAQWVGLLPVILFLVKTGRRRVARFVAIYGGLVLLLNAGCMGVSFLGEAFG